ncbi:MAG: TlpA family protein disulfide reductase [Kiritimatiellae bacterium]|nr:TlpA family protein disulfide reductase [Kiritimatiellia bacterium]NLD90165.1 TlpA family protein disulfide reductase [Lentisphaerota bacterium]HOU20751.1 TlpA disulfide reductase family protein [Kiritimatiellia bacterium]HPC19591.1 TlpA disulfide reductase family protein [Kiritimatiellia bacterium]HQN80124.1 TlpA disulfide reductase family protein [Kiritimatiellia bacterium]
MPNLASEFPGEIKTADHAGQVQLIQFLRTDDPGCRGSISEWNSLQAEFAARGFTCVGAVVDERPVAQLTREAGELAASFPVGLADAPVVGAFGGPAAIRAIPTAFLISREGVILRSYAGYTPLSRFREDIASALDGQPLPDVPPAPGATLPEKSTVKKTAP